jgi:hypothetical protein
MIPLASIYEQLPLEKLGVVGVYTLLTLTIVLIFCYKVIKHNDKRDK